MIKINMFSKADMVKGQGVGSAYLEQVALVKEGASDQFNVTVNSRVKADIYHHHSVNLRYYLKMKKKGIHVAYVHFLPETLEGSIKLPKLFFNIFKKYVVKFYKRADYLVVVNPIFIEALANYKIKKERIFYIPNYVSKKQFHKLDNIDSIHEKYKVPKDKFSVLGVGQIQNRKGIKDFVEVAKALPNINFVWAGGFSFGRISEGHAELKKVINTAPDNVYFIGLVEREEMNDIYNMCDLLFMPSYNELFPMAILEAVNSDIPTLLRNLDLYHDILFDKYLVADDNDGFVKEISKLAKDKKYFKKASDFSNYISTYYSKEHVLKLWIDFYNNIYNKKALSK